MKAKRITMLVEMLLFLGGILLAWYFTVERELFLYSGLFCNFSIGLSTGGMVAFLIEIPQIINLKKHNLLTLHNNAIHIYMLLAQWQNEVEAKKDKRDDKYNDEFNQYYAEKISPLVSKLMNLDNYIYLCKTKNKEIIRLKKEFNSFILIPDAISALIQIKQSKILINELNAGNNFFIVTNGMIQSELAELQGKIEAYIKTVDHVIRITSNKKRLKNWDDTINIIQNQLAQFKINNDTTQQ